MEQYFPFEVSELPYSYVGLVPRCDANTLYYHHDKYYAEAVYELNRLVVRHRLTDRSLRQLVSEDFNLPAAQLNRLKSAAGAVYNHQLFFDGIACKAGAPPFNRLTEAISASYGSMDRFQQLLTEAAESIIGSGGGWRRRGTGAYISPPRRTMTWCLWHRYRLCSFWICGNTPICL